MSINLQIKNTIKSLKSIYKNQNYDLHSPEIIGNERKYILSCLKKNEITSAGNFNKYLIKKIKKITSAKYVILTSSGTAAIHLILSALKVNNNHEILMPSLNYIATANSTLYCNSFPHFVEVNELTLGVDPKKLEIYLKKIIYKKNNHSYNKKTKKCIKALVVLHTLGHPCEIIKIKNIIKKYNIDLIEDCAEALGSYFNNKHVGIFGKASFISFNGNKIVTTAAGGAVITNNKAFANKVLRLSKISKKKHLYKYDYQDLGYNYSMPNINAALGVAQIENIKKVIKKKRNLYKLLSNILRNNNLCCVYKEPRLCKSNYWLQTLILKKKNLKLRNTLIEHLINNGLQSRPLWTLLHKVSYLKNYQKDNLKISEDLEKKIVNIPSNNIIN